MTLSRRSFIKTVGATAAIAIVAGEGPKLLRTRLQRTDVRELIQYAINTDSYWYRADILYPHPAGFELVCAPGRLMRQIHIQIEIPGPMTSKQFESQIRRDVLIGLQRAMERDGVGVYDLESWRLPMPRSAHLIDQHFQCLYGMTDRFIAVAT